MQFSATGFVTNLTAFAQLLVSLPALVDWAAQG